MVVFTDDKRYKVGGHDGRGGKLHLHQVLVIGVWLPLDDILETQTCRSQAGKGQQLFKNSLNSAGSLLIRTSSVFKIHQYVKKNTNPVKKMNWDFFIF